MSLPVLIDMNLSIEWIEFFRRHGTVAVHWSNCGPATAADSVLMNWAKVHQHVVFTHDLDFGTTLALTHALGPSVVQVRGPRVLPEHIGPSVIDVLRRYQAELSSGALVIVEPGKNRVRVLPL